MPTVPLRKQTQKLQAPGFPLVPFSAPQTERALGEAFGVVGEIADLFAAREVQRQEENDKINVSNLYYGPRGFKDQIRQISTEARTTTGKASENIGNDFITSYDKLGEDTLNSDAVENDEQRILLQDLIFKGRSGAITPVARHQATQQQLRKRAAQEQVVVDATMSVTEDPANLGDSLADIRLVLADQPEKLAREEKALRKIADEVALKNLSDATWNLAMPLDLESGEAIIKNSELPRASKKKMLKDFRDEKTIQQKREDDALIESQRATANDFDQRLDTLGIAEVETSNLEPGTSWGQLDYYRKKIADRADKIEKDKVDPFTEFDPATKSELQRRANIEPEGLTNAEIWDTVGKGKDGGTTAAVAQQIQIRRDANLRNVDTGRRNKTAHEIINDLGTKNVFNNEKTPEGQADNIFQTQRWQDALDQAIEDSKDDPTFDPVKWAADNIKAPAEAGFFQKISESFVGGPGRLAFDILNVEPQKGVPKRQQAVDILNQQGQPVDEDNIKFVMDQL